MYGILILGSRALSCIFMFLGALIAGIGSVFIWLGSIFMDKADDMEVENREGGRIWEQ